LYINSICELYIYFTIYSVEVQQTTLQYKSWLFFDCLSITQIMMPVMYTKFETESPETEEIIRHLVLERKFTRRSDTLR